MSQGFRDLIVYRKARLLARELRFAVELWPRLDRRASADQILRCSQSVGANIAEAYGRISSADRRRVLGIARGSATELEHWTDMAEDHGLDLPPDAVRRAGELTRMLTALINSLDD